MNIIKTIGVMNSISLLNSCENVKDMTEFFESLYCLSKDEKYTVINLIDNMEGHHAMMEETKRLFNGIETREIIYKVDGDKYLSVGSKVIFPNKPIKLLIIVSNIMQKAEQIKKYSNLMPDENFKVEVVNTITDYEHKIHGLEVEDIYFKDIKNINQDLYELLLTRVRRY